MDSLFLGLRVLVSLGAVLAVIWYAHRRITRGRRVDPAARPITVISRQGISQKASVVIVEADGRRLVLGVTEHSINVLSDSVAVTAVVSAIESKAPAHRADVFAERLAASTGSNHPQAEPGIRAAAAAASGTTATSGTNLSLPAPHGLLRGSILSAETWKLSLTALRQGLRT